MRKNSVKICIYATLLALLSVFSIFGLNFNTSQAIATFMPFNFGIGDDSICEEVYLGGTPLGISIRAEGLIVLGLTDVITENGPVMPEKSGEIYIGDQIIASNGKKIEKLKDLYDCLSGGNPQQLTLKRGEDIRQVTIKPLLEKISGKYKIGIMIKEEVNGIGTLTFITQDSKFASLGHKISDKESGLGFELNNGSIYEATVTGCVKGQKGKAGELQGGFSKISEPVGEIFANTNFGLYGCFSGIHHFKKIMTSSRSEIKMGKAQIYTTLKGCTPHLYDIEIVKSTQQIASSEKGLVFLVTDKELLELSGGIVQGMSGSPIIQDGKLIGAVTHVFVNDPTRGYGIYASFMLEEAKKAG